MELSFSYEVKTTASEFYPNDDNINDYFEYDEDNPYKFSYSDVGLCANMESVKNALFCYYRNTSRYYYWENLQEKSIRFYKITKEFNNKTEDKYDTISHCETRLNFFNYGNTNPFFSLITNKIKNRAFCFHFLENVYLFENRHKNSCIFKMDFDPDICRLTYEDEYSSICKKTNITHVHIDRIRNDFSINTTHMYYFYNLCKKTPLFHEIYLILIPQNVKISHIEKNGRFHTLYFTKVKQQN